MQEVRRYLTDDRDEKHRNERIVFQGGNGDWYVGVGKERIWPFDNFVHLMYEWRRLFRLSWFYRGNCRVI